MFNVDLEKWTNNKELISWIQENIKLCTPSNVHLCDGSEEEYNDLCKQMAQENRLVLLDSEKRPGSILFHSHPDDVARVEESTFICSEKKEDAGPTNNWKDPVLMKKHLKELFSGCMKGRTMYVIPYSMGPIGSKYAKIGVEVTDSPYVAVHMHIMTRTGDAVKKQSMDLILSNVYIVLGHLFFQVKKMFLGLVLRLNKNIFHIFLKKI